MGEAKKRKKLAITTPNEPLVVDTPGGRIQVQWDTETRATPNGQLAFFAEFLHTTGLYEAWVEECPLHYTSPNAPSKYDVLGTLLLSILAGHNRYAHITALRCDGVSPGVLNMEKIISEDAMRRGLGRIETEPGIHWLKKHLMRSLGPALESPWILDIDTTIKTLFGKQQGADIGYNPHKPGRPSHALHTYWMSNLRMVLDVIVSSGKQSNSAYTQPGLAQLLDALPPAQRPALVRGDCGYGNDPFIAELEARNQPYLFKLRQSPKVKQLVKRQFMTGEWTQPGVNDQGWSASESTLKLSGWLAERRVVVLRRLVKQSLVVTRRDAKTQLELFLNDDEPTKAYEYAVLVTDTAYNPQAIAQLYRDRADCENGFDELKRQWGWGGFTTRDIERCQTSARAVALIYNWWSWYCRAANPDARMEAITSRPLLLATVGRKVKHAGQTMLYLTPMHAASNFLIALISNIRRVLAHVSAVAEQFVNVDPWRTFLNCVIPKIVFRSPFLSDQIHVPEAS
jgi:Transposase DDE domain group 1